MGIDYYSCDSCGDMVNDCSDNFEQCNCDPEEGHKICFDCVKRYKLTMVRCEGEDKISKSICPACEKEKKKLENKLLLEKLIKQVKNCPICSSNMTDDEKINRMKKLEDVFDDFEIEAGKTYGATDEQRLLYFDEFLKVMRNAIN